MEPDYDPNDRPEWVDRCDRAVIAVDQAHHPGQDRWFFDPRGYVDAVLAVLREDTAPTVCPTCEMRTGDRLGCPDPFHSPSVPLVRDCPKAMQASEWGQRHGLDCPICHGTDRYVERAPTVPCPVCGGTGKAHVKFGWPNAPCPRGCTPEGTAK